tara:strand:- start:3044 stop:4057 length:1014 start_codon:yes stop_codon:yes gene_type:complete
MTHKTQKDIMIENAVARVSKEIGLVANAQGIKIDIDTLTGIKAKVTEQKFYEIKPSDFMPVVVGENAWADDILTWKSYSTGDNFESGLVDTGSNSGRLAKADTDIEGVKIPVKHWATEIGYNLMELAQATRSGNFSVVDAKETARLKVWQLGVQRSAFLGLDSVTSVKGLLTQDSVTLNTTTIAKNIKDMNATEFQAFIGNIMSDYFENSNSTTLPDTFVMPTDDFLGCVNSTDEAFPLKSRLERMKESFEAATGNANFEIKSLAYAQLERNGLGLNRYVLYKRADDTSFRMDIPVDYTTTITDTVNGFSYQSVAYGSFSSAEAYRPAEMIYFDHAV